MRKVRSLVVVGVGVWFGWRLRDRVGALDNYRGVGSPSQAETWTGSRAEWMRPTEAVEKARAIVELGRERGRDLLRQLLGRNAA